MRTETGPARSVAPRARKRVWIVLFVVLTVVWLAAGWLGVGWKTSSVSEVGVWAGRVYYIRRAVPVPDSERGPYPIGPASYRIAWLPSMGSKTFGWGLAVPLWIPAAIAVLPGALLWLGEFRAARRLARAHLCAHSGYDRTGLGAGVVCPECGRAAAGG